MILSTENTKKCYKCKCMKSLENFHRDSRTPTGHCSLCKECSKLYIEKNKKRRKVKNDQWRKDNKKLISDNSKTYYDNNKDIKSNYYQKNKEKLNEKNINRIRSNIILYLQRQAIKRAKQRGIPYEDNFLVNKFKEIPQECEVLHIPIRSNVGQGGQSPSSPSVDRIDSMKGYLTDNVRIISHRANLLKNNATFEEIKLVFEDSLKIRKNTKYL